ncbi:AbrB/MazE/SpoVT family DNA-binding domain-containing protein [Candidatus Woesearchaeota archaeon]|nr:AbrB/MazE/SpoVT family DNA-binding domain-containing protein [Candidatus Woesearchaeota archaeon]
MVKLKCPVCDKGNLRKGKIAEAMFGVSLGAFPALICSKCGESFTDEETTRKIQAAAKKKGIWGLGMKTKVTKAGNSLAVRVPKAIADFMDLKQGQEAYIHPEKDKLVIEK